MIRIARPRPVIENLTQNPADLARRRPVDGFELNQDRGPDGVTRQALAAHMAAFPEAAFGIRLWDPDPAQQQETQMGREAADALFFAPGPELRIVFGQRIREFCQARDLTVREFREVCHALNEYPYSRNLGAASDRTQRTQVLTIALQIYGLHLNGAPEEYIDQARKMPWTRLIAFLGDGTLSTLGTFGALSTAAAATIMVGSYCAGQMASMHAAVGLGAKMKAGALAAAAGVGSAVLGLGTAGLGAASVVWWYGVIQAYRDVYDHEGARDAYLFHRLRRHGVPMSQNAPICRHPDGAWTSPVAMLQAHLLGLRSN